MVNDGTNDPTSDGHEPDMIYVRQGDEVLKIVDPTAALVAVPIGAPDEGVGTRTATYVSGDAQSVLWALAHLAEVMTKRGMPLAAMKMALDQGYRVGQLRLIHGDDHEVEMPVIQVAAPGESTPPPEDL